MTAISTQRPLVLRSGIAATDVAALFDDWELRVAQDTTLYQMAGGKGQHTLETMWAAPHREMEGEVVAGGRMAGWEGSLWEAVGVVGLFVTASAPQTSSTPFWQIFCPRGPFPPGTLASSRFGCRSACRRARQRSSIEKWAGGADPPVVILISHIGHRSSHWS